MSAALPISFKVKTVTYTKLELGTYQGLNFNDGLTLDTLEIKVPSSGHCSEM
jgi:hypothetical protein